jgi:hypothetical protein
MKEGFIKLHRKITEWEWYKEPNILSLFIHILFLANWEDKQWHGNIIKRGSFITSVENLALEVGLSIQQTRTVLSKLEHTGEINKQTTNKYTLITINKYNDYQKVTSTLTNKQQTNNKQPNKQITTTKEYKNKEYKNIRIKRVIEKTYQPPNLTEDDFIEIANKYKTPLDFVKFQYDKMVTWAESKPNNPKLIGRNWKMTLMSFVRDDALKIKQDYDRQNTSSDISL